MVEELERKTTNTNAAIFMQNIGNKTAAPSVTCVGRGESSNLGYHFDVLVTCKGDRENKAKRKKKLRLATKVRDRSRLQIIFLYRFARFCM